MIEQIIDMLFSDMARELVRWGVISIIAVITFVYTDGKDDKEDIGCLIWLVLGIGVIIYIIGKDTWFVSAVYIVIIGLILFVIKRCIENIKTSLNMIQKERRFKRTKRKADNGANSNTYYELARQYEKGDGVKRSLKQAEKWYRKAAECGNAKMKREFGKRFEKGDHIARYIDMEEAQRWYDDADKWEKEHNKK